MRKRAVCFLLCMILLALAACSTAPIETEAAANTANLPEGEDMISDPRVSYLGPEGTYTEEATKFFFQSASEYLPEATVDDAIMDVVEGRADYAVIPQENTLGGAVTNYVDALIGQNEIYVVGEVILPISQTLMAIPGAELSDVKTVYSHAQGIKQSEAWRAEHLPDAETVETDSTAAAASYVAEQQDKSLAAVAAPAAAELYGLTVLAENVQITDANKTRFYVLTKAPLVLDGQMYAVFVADCEANRLDDLIVEIHNAGLELVAIHDRPEGSALDHYRYIIEVTNSDGITSEKLGKICALEEIRFFGCFDSMEKTP